MMQGNARFGMILGAKQGVAPGAPLTSGKEEPLFKFAEIQRLTPSFPLLVGKRPEP
jgi:hypothetical protein